MDVNVPFDMEDSSYSVRPLDPPHISVLFPVQGIEHRPSVVVVEVDRTLFPQKHS